MRIYDVLDISARNLYRRKTRTILTLVGVIIGTTSIAVMMSIGVGMDIAFSSELSKMGSIKVITVSPHVFSDTSTQSRHSNVDIKSLDDNAIGEISNIDGVEAVSPELSVNVKFTSGRNVAHVDLVGVDPSKMELFDYKIKDGRLLKSEDDNAVVFGNKVPNGFSNVRATRRDKIIPQIEPVVNVLDQKFIMSFEGLFSYDKEQEKRTKQRTYNAYGVGILKESGQNDYLAYININYLKKMLRRNGIEKGLSSESLGSHRVGSDQQYDRVLVKVQKLNNVDRVQKEINLMGFEVYSLVDARNQMKKTLAVVQAVLGAIGAIAILVSSLGITNTMYMSIFERNKEIGVIKVLGCKLVDIRKMFLVEAGLIGLGGGFVGIGLSYIISVVINMIADKYMSMVESSISVIPFWLAITSVMFSLVIAVGAGYFPSRRVMNISALDAIRNE